MLKHGSVIRRTMFRASFRRGVAEAYCENCGEKHGWLIAALLREMSGLEGKAMSEVSKALSISIDVSLSAVANDGCATTCFRGGQVETEKHGSLVWQKMATLFLAKVEENWKRNNGRPPGLRRREGTSDMQLYVGRQLLDYVPLQKNFGKDATRPD